ncbi:MAG: hypothetical protein ABSD31_20695 [Candidatus Binataceae bacterium]
MKRKHAAVTNLSLRELARRLERAPSGLHKLAVRGKIPRNADGSFDLAPVMVALKENLSPLRVLAARRARSWRG